MKYKKELKRTVEFSATCPVCSKTMALNNNYCSLKCYKSVSIEEEEITR